MITGLHFCCSFTPKLMKHLNLKFRSRTLQLPDISALLTQRENPQYLYFREVWHVNTQKMPVSLPTVYLYTCRSLLDNYKAGITLVPGSEQMPQLYTVPTGNLNHENSEAQCRGVFILQLTELVNNLFASLICSFFVLCTAVVLGLTGMVCRVLGSRQQS